MATLARVGSIAQGVRGDQCDGPHIITPSQQMSLLIPTQEFQTVVVADGYGRVRKFWHLRPPVNYFCSRTLPST